MAIVNRTPDSFFDRGATFAEDAALRRSSAAVADGADIIDIGGVKAGPGAEVDAAEEMRRTIPTVAAVRAAVPGRGHLHRHLAGRGRRARRSPAGADLLNDTWAGADPALAEVAAATGAGLVCSHAGGLTPRTRPHRAAFDDVVADVITTVTGLAERALSLGVRRDGILIDPAHDFGKNTRHSLEITRRLGELVATGWPVLVALSNKDFVGETLDAAGRRAARRHAGRDGGVGLAGRPGVPGPPGARDPPGAGHGRLDPRRPPAGRRPPRPGLTAAGAAERRQTQRRTLLRQA